MKKEKKDEPKVYQKNHDIWRIADNTVQKGKKKALKFGKMLLKDTAETIYNPKHNTKEYMKASAMESKLKESIKKSEKEKRERGMKDVERKKLSQLARDRGYA